MRQLFLIEGNTSNSKNGSDGEKTYYRIRRIGKESPSIPGLDSHNPIDLSDDSIFSHIDELLDRLNTLLSGHHAPPSQVYNSARLRSIVKRNANQHLTARIHDVLFNQELQPDMDYDALAKHLSISRSSLQKQIKRITGQSLSHAVNEIKIQFATELLKSTSLSIKEVANLSGFKTQIYFQVNFKKITGKTPTEYVHQSRLLASQSAAL